MPYNVHRLAQNTPYILSYLHKPSIGILTPELEQFQTETRFTYNVLAVCGIFAARIRKCKARPCLQKCGGVLAWEWNVVTQWPRQTVAQAAY